MDGTDGVMVSDFPGHIRVFPTHADGQDAAAVPAVTYPSIDATGIAELGGSFYLAQRTSGRIVRIDAAGNQAEVIVGGLPLALGIVGDPRTSRLFLATTNAPDAAIWVVDPVARTASIPARSGSSTAPRSAADRSPGTSSRT
jgi:hypothetical protein